MGEVRISPVEEWPEDARAALERLAGPDGAVPSVFTTLARHPHLFNRWLGLGNHVLNASTLPARTRELVILRTAARTGAAYEWAHHTVIGRRAGLTDEEIARIASGEASGWAATDLSVLRAVDELHETSHVSDATWSELARTWEPEQLMDLVMTTGFYTMTAMALNAFGVAVEPGFEEPGPRA
ncbi:MAG TPA: carboxymuconolactone decarboxylase family protein [Streptosporangiaceae bacterium]|jgi:AhpD family alkylhydroperoxidase